MSETHLEWTSPAPLWPATGEVAEAAVRLGFRQPAILRFATDSFMDEFLALLDNDPARLGELRARPESWRDPAAAPVVPVAPGFARPLHRKRLAALRAAPGAPAAAPSPPPPAPRPLKLYQPAHQRFYLVASCLVCRLPGLPDRAVDTGKQERVTFVVRRLRPRDPGVDPRTGCDPGACDEYAFLPGAPAGRWRKVTGAGVPTADVLVPGEEQLPLSAVRFDTDDGRKRRLLVGLVPAGKRDAYFGAPDVAAAAPAGAATAGAAPLEPRRVLFRALVAEPWKVLFDRAEAARRILREPSSPAPTTAERRALVTTAREQLQTVSWYILLDFAKYLAGQIPGVWQAITGQTPAPPLTGPQQTLVTRLGQTVIDDARASLLIAGSRHALARVERSLAAALAAVIGEEAKLEAARTDYRRTGAADPAWPSLLFPLVDGFEPLTAPVAWAPLPPATSLTDALDDLVGLVDAALPDPPAAAPVPPPPLAAEPPADGRDPGWFVIRCVYERPGCGPLSPPVVSEPTDVFQLAAFFDPDAPARPIRIGLPIDTTPAGLRKFDKNTAFMISDVLCGQMKGFEGLTLGDLVRSVLPWPFHKDLNVSTAPCGPSLGQPAGMMCTLSIPIVTICALILLIIIASLLDYVFRWLPYFQFCFPLPGFRAKD